MINNIKYYLNFYKRKYSFITMILFFLFPLILILFFYFLLETSYFRIFELRNLTEHLLELNNNNSSLSILVAIITIFVLFFTIVQFSISSSKLPLELVKNYIFFSLHTKCYISIQSGIILVLTINSFQLKLYTIDTRFELFLLLLTVFITFTYFFWVLHSTSTKGLVQLIVNRFDFEAFKFADKNLNESLRNYNQWLEKKESNIKYRPYDLLDFKLEQDLVIESNREGYITIIDIKKIDKILKEYDSEVDEVIFLRFFGDRVPEKDFYPSVEYNQPILKLRKKLVLPTNHQSKLNNDYEKLKKRLLHCIRIDRNTFLLEENRMVVTNLVSLIMLSFELDDQESEDLINEIQKFIRDIYSKIEQDRNRMVSIFLYIFLDEIKAVINKSAFNYQKYSHILDIIYSMNYVAIKNIDYNLHQKVIEIAYYLFIQAIHKIEELIYPNENFQLYLNELTYSNAYNEIFTEKKVKKEDIFSYYKIVYKCGIDNSVRIFIMLLKRYSYLPEEIRFDLLQLNAQSLLELPKNFIQDSLLEDSNISNEDIYGDFVEYVYEYLVKDLFDILTFLISKIKEKPEFISVVNKIILPLIIYFDSDFQYNKELTIKVLSEISVNYSSRTSDNFHLIEKVEIRPAGVYTPWILDDTLAKILIALTCYKKTGIFIPQFDSFKEDAVKKITNKETLLEYLDAKKIFIENYYSDCSKLSLQDYEIYELSGNEIKEILRKYFEYLSDFINKLDNDINELRKILPNYNLKG